MDTPCHRGKNRKYAANSKLAEHTGMPQRLYQRFLYTKKAVCSGVPEFAAYFRNIDLASRPFNETAASRSLAKQLRLNSCEINKTR